jgi:hypothetical protein
MLDLSTLHRRACKVLPEVLQTSGVVQESEEPSALAALLFPLRRKSSGSLRFRLSAAVIEAMAAQPLAYLDQALRARQGLGRRQAPFLYRRWRKASIPDMNIADARKSARPESGVVYFTSKSDGKALLLVVPDLRMALYIWNDHDTPQLDLLMRSLAVGEGLAADVTG